MNRREREAIERAFGEHPGNGSDSRETEYRQIRMGLQLLKEDVPLDQMSKERLRDAILARGLRPGQPEPAPKRFRWLWMPAASFSLVAAALLWRGAMPKGEPVVQIPETVTVAKLDTIQAPKTPPRRPPPTTKPPSKRTPAAKRPTPVAPTPREEPPVLMAYHREERQEAEEPVIVPVTQEKRAPKPEISESKEQANPKLSREAVPAPSLLASTPPREETIVLIGAAGPDGTSQATEVEAASHALVGG